MFALLIVMLTAFTLAMTPQQAIIARAAMKQLNVPTWSAIIDAALHDEVAFTDQAGMKVYIDAKRMLNTPHTWANVVTHEASHLNGAQHNDGQIGMSYMVTETAAGVIVDDSSLLLPSLAPLLWAAPKSATLPPVVKQGNLFV